MSFGINKVDAASTQRVKPNSVVPAKKSQKNTEADDVRVASKSVSSSRQSRAHVQQNIHQLERIIRHDIKDAVREAGDLDKETVAAMNDLIKDFRDDLQGTFHDAGRGHDFDHTVILSGVSDAIVAMTDRLRELRGAQEQEVPEIPIDEPINVPPTPTPTPEDKIVPEEFGSGGLLTAYA